MPPVYFVIFFPYVLIYFLMAVVVGKVSWKRTLLALVTGIVYIFCWMNFVASTSRIITIGADIFTLVQKLHLVAMLGWGIVTAGILLAPKEWLRVVGLTAGVAELIVGIPLALITAQELGRISLFGLAPVGSLALVVVLVWPGLWKKLTKYEDAKI